MIRRLVKVVHWHAGPEAGFTRGNNGLKQTKPEQGEENKSLHHALVTNSRNA